MRTNHWFLSLLILAMALSNLAWVAGSAGGTVTSDALGGSDRYLAHVSTDKTIYRPGETLHMRGVVLHARGHTPLPAGQQHQGVVEVIGPKGDTVASGMAAAQDSVVAAAWPIPGEMPGGQYTLKVSFPWQGYAPAERKFDIRAYRAPRLRSQIVFLRDGYGPGDQASATLHVERAEGGIPAGAKVTAIARIDGAECFRGEARVDTGGDVTVGFKLPAEIMRGEGTLALVIEDGGVVETASKTIPILLQTVDLHMYPEGGDLVAGLPARVYVEARTPAQKPADLAGVIVDAQGNEVATFRTEHEGRGRFAFTPQAGSKYLLKVREPAGIRTVYPLPTVKEHGAVLRSMADAFGRKDGDQPIKLSVASTDAGTFKVTLAQREQEIAAATVKLEPGKPAEVTLTPPSSADGVLVATLWSKDDRPLAERLIFRDPAKRLHVQITPDKSTYVPGDRAELRIRTTDDSGKPVAAVVGLVVTDDSVLEMLEKREQAPRLPAMVLIEPEVRELTDAHVYLNPEDEKAPLAVDLLMGTQGWRRFALVDAAKFIAEHGDAARRVLALKMVVQPRGAAAGALFERAGAAIPLPAAAPPLERHDVRLGAAVVDNAAAVGAEEQRAAQDRRAAEAEAAPVRQMREALQRAEADGQARRLLAAGDIAGGNAKAARSRRAPLRNDLLPVRIYAHELRPDHQPGDRKDFTETLYWNAGVRTDPRNGEATVAFALSDAVTSFRVFADAFDQAGTLGAGTAALESVEPFYIEPKLPLEVTSGDVIELPIAIVNGTPGRLGPVTLTATAASGIRMGQMETLDLFGKARERRILRLETGAFAGTTDFTLRARAGQFGDNVTRPLVVKPAGFPIEVARGGMLGPANGYATTIRIPQDIAPGSVTTAIEIYPTPLANLNQALERLIREPSGCFEQTSSTSYPLTMAQQYFLTHSGVEPRLIAAAREKLDRAYARLVSFECGKKGFEWFGEDPGHEALTAFGLLHFTDMAQVRDVDLAMVQATRAWLLKARDGQGGFKRERRALHTWIEDRACSDSYITWALLEAGEPVTQLAVEIDHIRTLAQTTSNSYVLALAANVMQLAGDQATAKSFMDRLVEKQDKNGKLQGATASIVGSGGEALEIEASALATLAWLRDPSYAGAVERSMRWLAESCKAGRFGSTQSTVLALRAIIAYDKARARPKAPGSVRIVVDGTPVGSVIAFDAQTQGAIKLPDISALLTPGNHNIELKMQDGSEMPFSLAVNYHSTTPNSSEHCKVGVEVSLRDARLTEGGITEAVVKVTNLANEAVPTPVAIIGIPGGLEVRHDQLKELVKARKIAAYEVIGRDVVLYWRVFQPGATVELPISLVAAVPGAYTGPASRAYLYYTDEFKNWQPGVQVTIMPAAKK